MTNLKQRQFKEKKGARMKPMGSEEEREGKGNEEKRMKGKEKK